ncbi:MAG: DUF1062 domain-containing protein [Pseudomonadota bacterium]
MCNSTVVRWTITPRIAPRPWIACGGCGALKPFQSSGKVRLNANGKRLDAWLIYKCIDCARSWNRPLFERRTLKEIDPAVLEAAHFSTPGWVRMQEFDIDGLRRHAQRIDEFGEVDIGKRDLGEAAMSDRIVIELDVTLPTSLRLDRLLAGELGLSRATLRCLHEEGRLVIDPDRKDVLRRRIRSGMRVELMGGL